MVGARDVLVSDELTNAATESEPDGFNTMTEDAASLVTTLSVMAGMVALRTGAPLTRV
jgi:hypothetical protein